MSFASWSSDTAGHLKGIIEKASSLQSINIMNQQDDFRFEVDQDIESTGFTIKDLNTGEILATGVQLTENLFISQDP